MAQCRKNDMKETPTATETRNIEWMVTSFLLPRFAGHLKRAIEQCRPLPSPPAIMITLFNYSLANEFCFLKMMCDCISGALQRVWWIIQTSRSSALSSVTMKVKYAIWKYGWQSIKLQCVFFYIDHKLVRTMTFFFSRRQPDSIFDTLAKLA